MMRFSRIRNAAKCRPTVPGRLNAANAAAAAGRHVTAVATVVWCGSRYLSAPVGFPEGRAGRLNYGLARRALSGDTGVPRDVEQAGSSPSTRTKERLSEDGQALRKKFLSEDGEKIDDPSGVKYYRAKEMDAYAAELIRAQEGSLELEARLAAGDLEVGDKSRNGAVEYRGAGVFLEHQTPPIDPDSEQNAATLTRPESRFMGRECVVAVEAPDNKRSVFVTGHPGTAKTRSGMTCTMQELLWRGEAVMRVGYKDKKAYLFLPDEKGVYKAWKLLAEDWSSTLFAADERAFVVIDPPEAGAYKDAAACKVIKWCSNNADQHGLKNHYKDGALLITAMPSRHEIIAMHDTLWSDKLSPAEVDGKTQTFEDREAKLAEVARRCDLVGCVPRLVFNGVKFIKHIKNIVSEVDEVGTSVSAAKLKSYYEGTTIAGSLNSTSVSSKLYFLNPQDRSTERGWQSRVEEGVARLGSVPVVLMQKQLSEMIKKYGGKRAFDFEKVCAELLKGGTTAVGGKAEFKVRRRLKLAADQKQTGELIMALPEKEEKEKEGVVVVAYGNFPVLDFATDRHTWWNAKVGESRCETKAGAFAALLTKHLKMAEPSENGDELVLKDAKVEIKLWMMRNTGPSTDKNKGPWTHKFVKELGDRNAKLDVDKLEALFKKIVTVDYVDVSKWPAEMAEAEIRQTTELLEYYGFPVTVSAPETAAAGGASK